MLELIAVRRVSASEELGYIRTHEVLQIPRPSRVTRNELFHINHAILKDNKLTAFLHLLFKFILGHERVRLDKGLV